MAKSQETFNKKEKEKKRLKKRQDKLLKKDERKANSEGGGLENMMAYLDEYGNIVDTPPDPTIKKKKIIADNIELGVPKREEAGEADANEGKVTFYNESKGYGFIKDGRNQENYFFHVNGLIDEVKENDTVTYELERGQKGMNAVKVKKV
ncbi:MAG: cold shock domain-containing protein [Crocinitomicaceae bacterium]|jgi:cold shock CspA family protein|nr:cold shock domain-containing protein [Crocinitomicaceae bacterium]